MRALLDDLGRDPARNRRRLLAAGVALAALAGAGFGVVQMRNARAELCAGGPDQIGQVWQPSTREQIRRAFVGTGLPFAASSADRILERLDAHTERWARAYGDVCRATHLRGEQSERLMDQRMACLQRDLAQTTALIETFTEPDAKVVERAVSAVDQLEDPSACETWTPGGDGPELDPERAALAERLRTELARARALHSAGRIDEAGALAQDVTDRAKAAKLPDVCARALTALARYQQIKGKWDEAERSLTEAVRMSTQAKDPRTEAQSWAALMFLKARERGELAAARLLMLPSETALERAGHPDRVEATYYRSLGALLMELGEDEPALDAYRKLVAIAERLDGEGSTTTASAWSNLAIALAKAGKVSEAEGYLRRAKQLLERTLGPDHPDVAAVMQNLANLAIKRGDYAEAKRLLLRVKATRQATQSPKLAGTLLNLGVANRGLEDLPAARDNYLEAEALMRATRGDRYPHLVAIYNNLANLFGQLGEPERALAYAEKAVALASERFKPGHRRRTGAWLRLCETRAATGAYEAARKACERALEELRAKHGEPRPKVATTGEALTTLAEIALATRHPELALEHARAARQIFRDLESEREGEAGARMVETRALWALGRRSQAAASAHETARLLKDADLAGREAREFLDWTRASGL